MAMSASEAQTPRIPKWTLGERFEKSRKQAGFSREFMAQQFRVSVVTIRSWEGDHRRPGDLIGVVRRWAELTHVDETWLAGLHPSSQVTGGSPSVRVAPLHKRHDRRKRKNVPTPLIVVMNDEPSAEAAEKYAA